MKWVQKFIINGKWRHKDHMKKGYSSKGLKNHTQANASFPNKGY
jgi:hypothetical protein